MTELEIYKPTTTVIDYIVQRLAEEGITDCFGVPGDYAFPVCDAVVRNPNIRWVGCSNELNAAYAADGYARVRGAAQLFPTHAVGGLFRTTRDNGGANQPPPQISDPRRRVHPHH